MKGDRHDVMWLRQGVPPVRGIVPGDGRRCLNGRRRDD
jgi:hypothetical protein